MSTVFTRLAATTRPPVEYTKLTAHFHFFVSDKLSIKFIILYLYYGHTLVVLLLVYYVEQVLPGNY